MIRKNALWFTSVVMIIGLGILAWLWLMKPPTLKYPAVIANIPVQVAEPLWGEKSLVVVFADPQAFNASVLGEQVAEMGVTAVIVDSRSYLQPFSNLSQQCLSADSVRLFLRELLRKSKRPLNQPMVVAGLKDGALLPFVDAATISESFHRLFSEASCESECMLAVGSD